MEAYAAVIGGINIDICGRSAEPMIAEDSNPGTVTISPGGVGRNIAHNLRLLEIPTVFVTTLGGDAFSAQAETDCRALGMDLSYALRIPDGRISSYVFLTQPDGNLALAVCDSQIAENMTPAVLEARMDVLNAAKAVVLDANLTKESVEYLAEHCRAPLFADPVSVRKAEKLRRVLGRFHTLKPNLLEAEALSGVRIRNESGLFEAANRLLETGMKRVAISLGAKGALLAEGDTREILPCYPAELCNVTGGGDAMMAGLVYGYMRGAPFRKSGQYALAAASMAVSCSVTNHPALSCTALESILGGNKV